MSDIPFIEIHQGVGIHDCQPRERIERRVKPEIDFVLQLADMYELARYAGDITKPPESRLLAGEKCAAFFELAVSERRARPDLDLDRLRASYGTLGSNRCRSPWDYCSTLDVPARPGAPRPEPREVPLTDEQRGLKPLREEPLDE
jgi:hypothetical protein